MNSILTNKPSGEARDPDVIQVLRRFFFEHLPPHQQPIAKRFAELAAAMADEMAGNARLKWGLDLLLDTREDVLALTKHS